MEKFAFLYIGGNVPDKLVEENNVAWDGWLDMLKDRDALVDIGAPLSEFGKVITHENVSSDYDYERDSSVSGYSIIRAEDMDTALELAMSSPQLAEKYGSGTIEVRHLTHMI